MFVPAVNKSVFVAEFDESPHLMVQFTDSLRPLFPTTSTALIFSDAPKSTFKKQLAAGQLLPLKYASFVRASVPVVPLVIEKLRALAKDILATSLLLIMEVVSAKGLCS